MIDIDIKSYLPVIFRYALVSAMTFIATRGWISEEQKAILGENLDILVSALVGVATVGYALIQRPSAKAMEVAKRVDAEVPASDMVVVKTPAGQADIVVHGK